MPTEDGGYQLYNAAGKLEGKKALITGRASGIGRAIAILFAMEGADSTIVCLPEEESDAVEIEKQVEKWGKKCRLISMDITSKENCQKGIDTALDQMGRTNILINNAAFQMMQDSIHDLSYEQWHKAFNTNIHPFFYLSKMALPHVKSGDTTINNASINADIGRPDLLDYTTTKGAIVAFTGGLLNQFFGKGIRVNAVCPGPF